MTAERTGEELPSTSAGVSRGSTSTKHALAAAASDSPHLRRARVALAYVAVGALLAGCMTSDAGSKSEPTPEFSVTPAASANYEREKQDPADCPDFSADAARDLLGITETPWVFDVIREVTDTNESGYIQCTFADPNKLDQQVVFQMNRIQDRNSKHYSPPVILSIMERLKSKSPLNTRFPGFGTTTMVGQHGGQSAMWACGNQMLTVSLNQGRTEQKDKSDLLWKHVEPAIQRHCGTLDQPAIPLAVDHDPRLSNEQTRPDSVGVFVRHEKLDLPTASSTVTSNVRSNQEGGKTVQSSGHLSDIKECAMFSGTEAVRALGMEDHQYWALGSRTPSRLYFGRRGDCNVSIKSKEQNGPTTHIGSGFVQYAMNSDVELELLESTAAAYADPVNRGPYVGKYRGFGAIGDYKESRTVTWLCGGYLVEGIFRRSEVKKHIDDADLWSLTEPTIRRICGKPDEPMTPPLGWDLRRVDYTQLLMEDWKIGTDNQLTSPPATKRYLRAAPTSTLNG